MFTAKEAKALQYSFQNMSEICSQIGDNIRELIISDYKATKYYWYIDSCPVNQEIPELDAQNKLLVQMLLDNGYVVYWKRYGDSYIPRGLADDWGNGPSYQNYGLVITWGNE